MKDGIIPIYVMLFPKLKEIAYEHGYVLFCHGSLKRDMDLFLFPWEVQPKAIDIVIDNLAKSVGAKRVTNIAKKPFGRKSIALAFQIQNLIDKTYYIDLSYIDPEECE